MDVGESWNRDLILANFQAASGLDDIETCINILESNNWNLQTSLNTVFSDDRDDQVEIVEHRPSITRVVQNTTAPPDIIDIDERDHRRMLIFQILHHEQTLPVTIMENQTVGDLKKLVEAKTDLKYHEINLEGWPSGNSSINDRTLLSSLDLMSETHLVLPSHGKVTVSLPEYMPCNIVDCNTSNEDEEISPRVIDVCGSSSSSTRNDITLNVNHNGRDYRLKYYGDQTVKEVKLEIAMLTKISLINQNWTGWPSESNDKSKLKDLDLSPDHFLIVTSKSSSSSTSMNQDLISTNKPQQDSGMAGSPEELDVDEDIISDDDQDDDFTMFDDDKITSKQLKSLLPSDSNDSVECMIQLQCNFQARYGETHPPFFMGTLIDAINTSSGDSARDRKPLLIYLHHDGSILTNVFCSQILCADSFVSYVGSNFVIWPWDMTVESNRQRFINLLMQHLGSTAAAAISKFRNTDYPLLLVAMKSKAGLEVCTILQANTSLDDLMSQLINGYEVFEQTKLVEIKEEDERKERELMKQEQDSAYLASLAADKAKEDAEKQKSIEERKVIERKKLEEQIKEAERISCIEHVPDEPPKEAKNSTTIRFRFPGGTQEIRRFCEDNRLKVVQMYITSKGFNTNEHCILTNYPKRKFVEEDFTKTLKELKLCPQVTLFIEEI